MGSSRRNSPELTYSPYGFAWGPMLVERTAHDDRIGWVLRILDDDGKQRVLVRVSPQGKKWTVETQ